jgi:lysophospholipase L1-like esterase
MMSSVTRRRTALAVLLGVLLALVSVTPAGAKPVPVKPLVKVEIGRTAVGVAPSGLKAILVPVRYPIQLGGRLVEMRISLLGPAGGTIHSWVLHERLAGGRVRRPDRRRGFTFVHRLGLNGKFSRRVQPGVKVRVVAIGRLDLDEDGRAELRSRDRTTHAPTFGPRNHGICSDVPHLRVQPGQRISVPLPVCDTPMHWSVPYRVHNGRIVYRAPKHFRGRVYFQINGRQVRSSARASGVRYPDLGYVQVTVGAAGGAVARALGDSVTAGFGFYDDGSSMTIGHLLECRPGTKEFDDACSSNSLNRVSKEGKVEYASDFGLSNNVSWAAQWANSYGVTNYKNYAISGSEPSDWAPEGEFHETTERIEAEDPDYILLTMGANPLLSNMLFGFDNMGCAVESDILGGYRECIEEAFAEVHLREHLRDLYADLVQHTEATIFLMQYHLSVPSTALAYSATQIAMMGKLLNREIASVAAEVSPQRLQVVAPPHFSVGIDISPVFPSRYTCSRLGFKVDGPSVQSDPTQDELELLHPLSFCSGEESFEPPWVISGDTGIHPSAAGYTQMASRVPPPS